MSVAKGGSVWFRCTAVAVVMAWTPAVANAAPLLAQAGQALVAPGLDQAAKPVKPAGDANAAAAADRAASAPAAASGSSSLMKYAPSYALMTLLVGLGTFIICRPKPRVKAK